MIGSVKQCPAVIEYPEEVMTICPIRETCLRYRSIKQPPEESAKEPAKEPAEKSPEKAPEVTREILNKSPGRVDRDLNIFTCPEYIYNGIQVLYNNPISNPNSSPDPDSVPEPDFGTIP